MNISTIFEENGNVEYSTVYEDVFFSRKTATLSVCDTFTLTVIKDCHVKERISFYSFSLFHESQIDQDICLEIGRNCEILESSEMAFLAQSEFLLFMPKHPISRDYDKNGNIICDSEKTLETVYLDRDGMLTITLPCPEAACIEFHAVTIHQNQEQSLHEITHFTGEEKRHVKTFGFFDYSSLEHTWDHFTRGTLFHVDYTGKQSLRWECQQCANSLYGYLRYLHHVTQKGIYLTLCRQIAYCVMLSLPGDGRWRHGHWTDAMETHTRHQVEGIDLMVSAFEDFGNEMFLQKSNKAMDFVLSIAETLDKNQLWFVHDTCESNQDIETLRSVFRDFFVSTAFGKSQGNTLCLNTHILTMAVLTRLNQHSSDTFYSQANEKAQVALQKVMHHKSGSLFYWGVYMVRDTLIRMYTLTNRFTFCKLSRKYTELLKKRVLPVLKKHYPRLLMPNGFLERDLSAVHVSDLYFLVNLQDFMVYYSTKASYQMRLLIEIMTDYMHKSRYINYMSKYDERVSLYTNIMLMCMVWFDFGQYAPRFIDSIISLRQKQYAFSADIFGHWAMSRNKPHFKSKNLNIYTFSLKAEDECLTIFVNPTDIPQALQITALDAKQMNNKITIKSYPPRNITLKNLDQLNSRECIMIRFIKI